MFVDASAIVAVLADEPERRVFAARLGEASNVITSPLALYGATLGLRRVLGCSTSEATDHVRAFLIRAQATVIKIDSGIGFIAIDAFERFGKGRHRASLNMGDCFSYACAKTHGMPLLFKGDDFIHTDVQIA